MAHSQKSIESIENKFIVLVKAPEKYLSPQDDALKKFKPIAKSLYDIGKDFEQSSGIENEDGLPQLIVQNFDDEQIWQQLELNNNFLQPLFLKKVSSLSVKKNIELRPKVNDELKNADTPPIDYGVNDEKENFSDDFSNEEEPKTSKVKKLTRSTVVDDKFFKVDELEDFLRAEEDKERSDYESESDSEEVDFNMDPDVGFKDQSGRKARYEEFFDPPHDENAEKNNGDKSGTDDEEEEAEFDDMDYDTRDYNGNEDKNEKNNQHLLFASSDDEENNSKDQKSKSTFEIRQEKVKQKISDLEENNLAEKPWQLKGEIAAGVRPENSVLEEHLQFEHNSRQAPVITEETTLTLEQIIKRRIKDQAWDDVIRKEKQNEEPFEYKKRITLDQEKSKESLAHIYEQEYIKQQNKEDEDEPEELPEHIEIKKMMFSLFSKLDALSNYHFTPRPSAPEIKIVSNLPAIAVEEVAPSSVSDGALLAPEEVMKKVSNLKGDSERTKEDKKHDLKKSKKKAKIFREEKEKRQKLRNPGAKDNKSKEDALKELEKMGSNTVIVEDGKSSSRTLKSKTFFSKLQDQESARKLGDKKVKPKKKVQVNSTKIKL